MARLVACGFNQVVSINYFKTFSPMVKRITIHLILSLTISTKWPIHQLDVDNSLL